MTGYEREHLHDPRDDCDATVLLDDTEVLVEIVERYVSPPRWALKRTEYGWAVRD